MSNWGQRTVRQHSVGRRRLAIGLGTAALLALLPGRAQAAMVLIVDDNMACAGAAFTTIQTAVTAASPGDTVSVCSGTYPETVTVTKALTLKGAQAGVDARTRSTATSESRVTGSAGGFVVQAGGVVIDGFTVKNAINAPGIHLYAAHNGSKVTNNIIKNNTFGIYANSSGPGLTTVNFNRFSDNNVPGSAAGNGIYSDQGLSGGRIKNNLFERNGNAGVVVALTAVTVDDLVLSMNESVDNATFAAVFHGTNVQVKSNLTRDTDPSDDALQGSAVFIGGDVAVASVQSNVVKDSPFNGIAVRMQAGGVTVQGNDIRRAGNQGISISSSTPGAATITANTVRFSHLDGISLTDTTSGNTVTGNVSVLNNVTGPAAVDCLDVTLGGGTSGTANTWSGNTGSTSSPPSLCTSSSSLEVALTGAAVPSGGDPDAAGTARLFLDSTVGRVCYDLTWANVDGTVTAAHLHNAPAGQTGPNAVDLFEGATHGATGAVRKCVAAPPLVIMAMLNAPEQYYVDLHSTGFTSGALRAQLA